MSRALLEQVRDGNLDRVRAETRDLTEADRRQLAASAIALLREIREAYVGRVLKRPWPYGSDVELVVRSAQILVLGTVSPAELRKVGQWGVPPDDLAFEMLMHRTASIAGLIDAIADEAPTRWNSRFKLMRSLVRAGATDRPTNPGYILAMINGLETRDQSVYDALKSDPGLLEYEVWRLFEIEGAGETSLAAHDKYCSDVRSWGWALTMLSGEGQLSRGHGLDASLAALRRDFEPFRAGWFSRFHEALKPTPKERREREGEYVALLSSPVPATVSFSVHALLEAGGISEAALDRLSPALEAKAATTVKAAIKLLPKSERGAALAANGLRHATRDAQAALLAFISRLGHLEPQVVELVSAAGPDLAPSLRDQAKRLVGARVDAAPDRPTSAQLPAPSPVSATTEKTGPVQSVAELVELLATLLEHVQDPHDLERALDGVSRLCDRTEDTIRRLAPIARRARQLLADMPTQPFAGMSPRADMAGLVVAWASGEAPPLPSLRGSRIGFLSARAPTPRRSVLGFLSYRVLEVARRAACAKVEPMLSLPTISGGAIDPAVVALRRDELRQRHIKPGEADAIQAALRAGEIQPSEEVGFRFGSGVTSHSYQGKTYKHVHFQVHVEPPPRREPTLADVPELFVAAISARGGVRRVEADYCGVGSESPAGLREAVRWVGTVWPANREPFYAKGAVELGQNIDWWEARWHARHFLEPLLLASEPIREMGRLLLALALGAKEPGERALATDVFVTGITQSRLEPEQLGVTLGRLYDQRVVKGSRLASALFDVGRVSDRHAEAVVTSVEHLLACLSGPPPSDLHAILDGLSDLLTTLRRDLRLPAARAYLSGIEGAGKGAAAAKMLLKPVFPT